MAIKPGDHVRFLHEKQEGTVIRLLGSNKAEVLVDDFLEIEVGLDEIVSVAQGEEMLRKKSPNEVNAPVIRAKEGKPELLAARDEEGDLGLWFCNATYTDILFVFFAKIGGRYKKVNAGIIHAEEKLFIGTLSNAELHQSKQLIFQGLSVPAGEGGKPGELMQMEIPLRYAIFNTSPAELTEIKRTGHRLALTPELLPTEMTFEVPHNKMDFRQSPENVREVIDLHIEELAFDVEELDSLTMLEIQLKEFEKRLDLARFHGLAKITFIHGVGNGVLKKEILNRLARVPWVKKWNAADPHSYGNGATEVHLIA
jgi:dsDNA-specific endonuclease/ATPase MutS2